MKKFELTSEFITNKFGDLEEFRAIVKRTHGDGKMAKEYLAIADLMEMHFGDERNE